MGARVVTTLIVGIAPAARAARRPRSVRLVMLSIYGHHPAIGSAGVCVLSGAMGGVLPWPAI
jgi:hypothetical protein